MAGADKLTEMAAKNSKPKEKPYKLADGGGLYLEIMPNGSKYWRMKYRHAGKEKRLALGVYPQVTLKVARKKKLDAKESIDKGVDPANEKKQEKLSRHISSENQFGAIALEWYKQQSPNWSESHIKRAGWLLEKNLFPWLANRPIAEIPFASVGP